MTVTRPDLQSLDVQGWLLPDEREQLRLLAATSPVSGFLVDVGSHAGLSAICLASGAGEASLTVGPLLCVEPFSTKVADEAQVTADTLKGNLTQYLSPPWAVLLCTSEVAAGLLPDGCAAVVFIDADHSYEAVVQDIALWWPKVRPGGRLALHDYYPIGFDDYPPEFLEFEGNYPDWPIARALEHHGLPVASVVGTVASVVKRAEASA